MIECSKKLYLTSQILFSTDEVLLENLKMTKSLAAFKDGKKFEYEGEFVKDNVHSWMKIMQYPQIVEIDEFNSVDILSGEMLVLLALLDPSESVMYERSQSKLKDFSSNAPSNLIISYIDAVKFKNYLSTSFGTFQTPFYIIFDPKKEMFYANSQGKPIASFVDDVFKGKIKGSSTKSFSRLVSEKFANAVNYGLLNPLTTATFFILLIAALYIVAKKSKRIDRKLK